MRVEITGLQIASPDEQSLIVRGRPLWVQVELVNHLPHPVEVEGVVDFADVRGLSRLTRSAPMVAPPGRCWAEMRLPPDSLPLGRYSLSVALVGHDLHRSRRLVDVLQVPPGLPPRLSEPWGRWSPRPGDLPRDALVWRVEQVRISVQDTEPAVIPPGAPVEMVMRFDLNGLPPGTLLRLQIFSNTGELVLGTNSRRWGICPHTEGRWVLRARFESLNLAPGNYLITVGLWEEEGALKPYQARHGYYELFVGTPTGVERLASTLELLEHDDQGEQEHEPVRLLGEDRVTRGQWVNLRLTADRPTCCRVWLEQDGQAVAEAMPRTLVCQDRTQWQLKLKARVPQGEYTLCHARWNTGEAAAGPPTRSPLRVTDEQELS